MAALNQVDWIIALITIAFCMSAFGNGANDVANSYATSVAARTLTLPQVGVMAACTEFIGAVALGSRVTDTIKNGIIDLNRFNDYPNTLVLAMGCAEFGAAFWLLTATRFGFPVSTTQTIVGALVGVGIVAEADISWAWKDGSVSQVAASWGIAPAIAAGFSAILFLTIKYSVLHRKDSLKWAMRLIPVYLAFTAAVLALFIVVELPGMEDLAAFGAGKAVGIILGVFAGVLLIAYVFFMPYFHRRLIKGDPRLRFYHVPLGPTLLREDPWIYFPAKGDEPVIDYYANAQSGAAVVPEAEEKNPNATTVGTSSAETQLSGGSSSERDQEANREEDVIKNHIIEPEERFLAPTDHLPLYNPKRMWAWIKYILLQGVTRDCVSYDSERLKKTHEKAVVYENRVEHLWTYCQVASAIIMSIAHGSNDVANAVGPWVAAYNTWKSGEVDSESDTPVWILAVAGILLGGGFWFLGWRIIRSLGNRITRVSPTRGYSMELGAAITVLLASRLGLPVSTTQCLTGATLGVALMNFDMGAVNWRQLGFILIGWILTLPMAGLMAGILLLMSLNTPSFWDIN
ncbi:phosphate transporter [Hortaea werneckii]|nr:phosphate transporter [Hortaea werneckii]